MSTKVVFITNNSGGLYRFRREVVEAFCKKAEVYLCMPDEEYREHWESIGCKFAPCSFDGRGTNPFKDLKQLRTYKKILDEIKPDLCFTFTIKPNVYGGMACAAKRIPYVANVTGLGTAVESGGVLAKVSLMLYKRGLRKARKVFFQNKENKDFMVGRGIVSGPYEVLPGSGVNLEQFALLPYPSDKVRFSFIGRIMREKGIEQFLEAAEEVTKKHPDVEFHVFGGCEQDYEGQLRTLQEKGVITFHGSATNMTEVYQMTSCTVHPSYYPEGMSNVLLESCASGRPIITTDRPGCREALEDGVNGFVIEKKNAIDLIDKIERFLALSGEERRKMGLAGRTKVEREFDRKIVVRKYLKEMKG